MRQIVLDYLVCYLEKMMKSREFKSLLRNEGYFADDLLSEAMKRLE